MNGAASRPSLTSSLLITLCWADCNLQYIIKKKPSDCTATLLRVSTVPTKRMAMSGEELFCSLWISVSPVLCYQLLCHNCLHFNVMFTVAAETFLTSLETDDNQSVTNSSDICYFLTDYNRYAYSNSNVCKHVRTHAHTHIHTYIYIYTGLFEMIFGVF